jgi:hypothetical protein
LVLCAEQRETRISVDRLLIWAGEKGWAGGWRTEAAQVELGFVATD